MTLQVPERPMTPHQPAVSTAPVIHLHAHGAERLNYAKEEISVEEQTPVRQPVGLDISRPAGQKSLLGFLERKAERRKNICGDTNNNHLD